ncbi:hypothetical protein BH11PSE11_BH11PSE11_23520 [soil metagenome]
MRQRGGALCRAVVLKAFAALFAACLAPQVSHAGELILNGGFEANGGLASATLGNWNIVRQSGSRGNFFAQAGTRPPLVAFPVPTPPAGSFSAMSDQVGPGSTVLYQDVALPADAPTVLSMRLFVLNQAERFYAPATLDYSTVPNQQVRVDIMNPAASPFDMGAGVLGNLFVTLPGYQTTAGYITINADLSTFAGQTIRLRIAEVDNQQGLNVGIDAVSLDYFGTTTAPEAPGNVSVVAGYLSALVSFTAPANNGGSAVTSYQATCIAPGQLQYSATGTGSPIKVTGLSPRVPYTCRVVANNGAYNSVASAAAFVTLPAPNTTPLLYLLLD